MITFSFKELGNAVEFAESLLNRAEENSPLTVTIDLTSHVDFYAVNVTDDSDIILQSTGSEKQPTTSKTHRSGI